MIPGSLTLFNWTLRMDARAVIPHFVRAGFAFFMLFSISIAFFDAFGSSRTGLRFFQTICSLNIVVITVAGVSWFVTAVTEEKEAGTFALLRLAGMTPLSITLGKSTSRLISSLMLLIVQLPFTFLAITLGGVLWRQVLASYLALAAWMILVSNLALFCSVRCVTSGRAASLATVVLLLFFLLPVMIDEVLTITPGSAAVPPAVMSAGGAAVGSMPAGPAAWQTENDSPLLWLARIAGALRTVSVWRQIDEILTPGAPVVLFSSQFWWSLLLAAVFFAISTFRLEHWSALASESRSSLPEQTRLRRTAIGRSWPWAVSWKEFHFFTGGRLFLVVKLLSGATIFGWFLWLESGKRSHWQWSLTGDRGWQAFQLFLAVFTAEVLVYASGCLFSELRQGTQGVLATLPQTPIRTLWEKAAGCVIALSPAILWLAVTLYFGLNSIRRNLEFEQVISFLIMLLFAAHAAALFSLFTRWAALPLTVLACVPAFFVMALPVLALSRTTQSIARSQNIEWGPIAGGCVTLFWCWLFVLLPMQLAIRDRWQAVCRR